MGTSASRLTLATRPTTDTMVTAASRITATVASIRATSSCGANVIPAVTAGNTSRGIVAGVIGRKCHDRHKTDVRIRTIAAVAAVVDHNCTAKRGVLAERPTIRARARARSAPLLEQMSLRQL